MCHGNLHGTSSRRLYVELQIICIWGPVIGSARSAQFSIQVPRPFQDDQDRRDLRILIREPVTGFNREDHNLKLWAGWCVSDNVGAFCHVGTSINGGASHTVGQHVDEVVYVFEFWCQSRSNLEYYGNRKVRR
jgi:hypothetical protein